MIVGVQATAARLSQETVAAEDMLTRFAQWPGRKPESVGADTTYGNGEFLQWLAEREITPYMRTRASAKRKNSPFYGPERFTYQPGKQPLSLSGGRTAQLCWVERSPSGSGLHWQRQTLRSMLAKTTMHEWTIQISCHPHG